jgi:hypothetical protein
MIKNPAPSQRCGVSIQPSNSQKQDTKTMKKKLAVCLAAAILSGCGAPIWVPSRAMITPIVDATLNPKGRNYYQDVSECNDYASHISAGTSAVNNGAGGAALGAVFGAIIGAALGVNPAATAAWGAASGGVSGAARGAVGAQNSKHMIVSRCMAGRGYTVLQP